MECFSTYTSGTILIEQDEFSSSSDANARTASLCDASLINNICYYRDSRCAHHVNKRSTENNSTGRIKCVIENANIAWHYNSTTMGIKCLRPALRLDDARF